MIDGQISLFDILPDQDEQEALIREACRNGSRYEGYRVRTWAMLESGWFPQYRDLWMKDEFGIGGYSMRNGWFLVHDSTGIRITQLHNSTAEIRLTWKQVVRRCMELIAVGDFLDKDDERKLEAIAVSYKRLPYPRPRFKYPECAWGEDETPKWRDEKEEDE